MSGAATRVALRLALGLLTIVLLAHLVQARRPRAAPVTAGGCAIRAADADDAATTTAARMR